MTLDEAIEHAEEVADKKEREKQKWEKWLETDSDYRAVAEKVSCELCAEEHRQLAEWLKDYKRLLEQQKVGKWLEQNGKDYTKYYCSNCYSSKSETIIKTNYCSYCGAFLGGNEDAT